VLRNRDDADDAAQDAFLAALVALSKFDRRRPFAPWLLRIVVNTALDRHRRRAVRRAEPLDGAVALSIASEEPGPDEESERLELAGRLREALDRLAPRRRLAVVLFDVEGYSHAEIAAILGMREGTVRAEVFHGRRELRASLERTTVWEAMRSDETIEDADVAPSRRGARSRSGSGALSPSRGT